MLYFVTINKENFLIKTFLKEWDRIKCHNFAFFFVYIMEGKPNPPQSRHRRWQENYTGYKGAYHGQHY